MKTRNRSNALLLELLIVILVFMLASTLVMRIFAKAHALENQSRLTASVLAEAQGHADRLYAAADPEQALRKMGYVQRESDWVYQGDNYTTAVTLSDGGHGLTRQELTVRDGAGEVLLTLPCSRWREVSP